MGCYDPCFGKRDYETALLGAGFEFMYYVVPIPESWVQVDPKAFDDWVLDPDGGAPDFIPEGCTNGIFYRIRGSCEWFAVLKNDGTVWVAPNYAPK